MTAVTMMMMMMMMMIAIMMKVDDDDDHDHDHDDGDGDGDDDYYRGHDHYDGDGDVGDGDDDDGGGDGGGMVIVVVMVVTKKMLVDRALQVDRVLGAAASPATQLPECSFTDGHGPVFLRVKPTRFSIVEVSMYLSFADFVYFLLSSGAKCFSCGKYVVFITLNNESQRTVTPPSPGTLNLYPNPKMMALFVTLLLEGAPLFYEVLSGYHLVRFAIAALLFTLAQGLVLTAFCVGASPVEVVTFGYIHMPVSAVLSYFAFSRRYGRLEWLSVGMLTLGVLAFVLLREESAEGETLQLELHGFLLVMGSVFASVLGSIIAERIFKDRPASPAWRLFAFRLLPRSSASALENEAATRCHGGAEFVCICDESRGKFDRLRRRE
eukprot:s4126_g2.t1